MSNVVQSDRCCSREMRPAYDKRRVVEQYVRMISGMLLRAPEGAMKREIGGAALAYLESNIEPPIEDLTEIQTMCEASLAWGPEDPRMPEWCARIPQVGQARTELSLVSPLPYTEILPEPSTPATVEQSAA